MKILEVALIVRFSFHLKFHLKTWPLINDQTLIGSKRFLEKTKLGYLCLVFCVWQTLCVLALDDKREQNRK